MDRGSLSTQKIDILKEIGTIGAGNVTTAMKKWYGEKSI